MTFKINKKHRHCIIIYFKDGIKHVLYVRIFRFSKTQQLYVFSKIVDRTPAV